MEKTSAIFPKKGICTHICYIRTLDAKLKICFGLTVFRWGLIDIYDIVTKYRKKIVNRRERTYEEYGGLLYSTPTGKYFQQKSKSYRSLGC